MATKRKKPSGEVLALTGGMVCRLDPADVRALTVVIEDGKILELAASPPEGATVVDCTGLLLLPGLVNAHTRLWTAAVPRQPFTNHMQRLERSWWPVGRALDAEALSATAEAAALIALKAGTTALFDLHGGFSGGFCDGSLDVMAAACERVGIRGVLGYATGGDVAEGRRGSKETDRFLASLQATPRPRIRGLVGAAGSYLLRDETAEALADLALRHRTAFHLPVAEDSIDATRTAFVGAAAWLLERGLCQPGSVFANGGYLSDDDCAKLGDSGVYWAHLPRAGMLDGADYARPGRFGAQLVVGSGHAGADVAGEAVLASLLAAEHHHAVDVISAVERGRMLATWHFGVPFELLPEAVADVVAFAHPSATVVDAQSLAGDVLQGSWRPVHVVVDGEVVIRDGKSTRVDESAVFAAAQKAVAAAQKAAKL